jgi:hypothetical protein
MSENRKQSEGGRKSASFRAGDEKYREPIRKEHETSKRDETHREPKPQETTKTNDQG